MHDPDVLSHATDLARQWLREVAAELYTNEGKDAWTAFREVTHLLRDHLPDTEGAQLAAQLPMLLRGVWYEGWRPGPHARVKDGEAFLEALRVRLDRTRPMDPALAVRAVTNVLRRHVSRGELEDVIHVLPGAIKPLFRELAPLA
jgi:uncharacterized protein (DUF2267 family)